MQALPQMILLHHRAADLRRPPPLFCISADTQPRWLRLHGVGTCMHVLAGLHPSSGGSFLQPAALRRTTIRRASPQWRTCDAVLLIMCTWRCGAAADDQKDDGNLASEYADEGPDRRLSH